MARKEVNRNKKQALGRGLGSLLGNSDVLGQSSAEKDSEIEIEGLLLDKNKEKTIVKANSPTHKVNINEEKRIWSIRIDHVFANKNQPRKVFDKSKIDELALSIKEQGVLQPIVCKKINADHYEIIAGERRWRASQKAGLKEVPVILKNVDEKTTLELALVENIQRQDLNPMEEAQAFKNIIDSFNLTQQELAQRLGVDRVGIANKLRLLKLPSSVRERVASEELSLGLAKVILSLEDESQQVEACEKILKEKMTVRAAEKYVAMVKAGHDVNLPKMKLEENMSAQLMKGIANDMQRSLGTKVKVDYKAGKGKITLHFYSDEELNRLVERIKKDD